MKVSTYLVLILNLYITGCATFEQTQIQTQQGSTNVIKVLAQANKAYSEQRWLDAEVHYRTLINFMEQDEFSHFRLGNSLLRQGRLEDAIKPFKAALEINPDFNEARHNLSTCYILLAGAQLELMEKNTEVGMTDDQNFTQRRTLLIAAAGTPF